MSTILEKIASIEAEVIAAPPVLPPIPASAALSLTVVSSFADGPHPEEQGDLRALGSAEGETGQAQARADYPEGRRRGWRAGFRGRQDRRRSYRLRRCVSPDCVDILHSIIAVFLIVPLTNGSLDRCPLTSVCSICP